MPTTYMGRIFLLPKDHLSSSNPEQIWINVGWNTDRNRLFPSYLQVFSSFLSQFQYDALMKDLKEYMDRNALNFCAATCALSCFILVFPLLIVYLRAKKYTRGLQRLLEQRKKELGITVPIRLVLTQATHTKLIQPITDQYFKPLLLFSEEEPQGSPMWPPLGYNFIIDVPLDCSLANVWYKKINTVDASNVVIGIRNKEERLEEANGLLQKGKITEAEFRIMRQKILEMA